MSDTLRFIKGLSEEILMPVYRLAQDGTRGEWDFSGKQHRRGATAKNLTAMNIFSRLFERAASDEQPHV
jgi:hypothetical protein